jgi:hypothetical protein
LVVQRAFPAFLARYFQLEPTAHWDFLTAAQGIGIAILASLLFTLPPLIGIRHIRPSLILRREMEEIEIRTWRARWPRAARLHTGGRFHRDRIRRNRDVVRHRHSSRHVETGEYFAGALVGRLHGAVRHRVADAAPIEIDGPPQAARQPSDTASRISIAPALTRNRCWWRSASA